MNPWLVALIMAGAAVVFFTIHKMFLGFIGEARRQAVVAEQRVEQAQGKLEDSFHVQLAMSNKVALDNAAVLKGYNESNAETARQLKILAESVRRALDSKGWTG